MRIIILLFMLFWIGQPLVAVAQNPQEEMKRAVNELKKQITDQEKQIADAKKNNEDAETIKAMEDQLTQLKQHLGMIEKATKTIANMPVSTISGTAEDQENTDGVPKRDVTRINMLPKKILSDAELASYLKEVTTEVEKKISTSDKTKALELYNETMKTEYNSPKALGNIAGACWMNGYPEMALFIMGKVCMSDMSNANNLNNYAAFLTMAGGEHAALPILQNLDLKYPDNSTILNNIGQAWYGLGDMNNANQYLDKSIHLYSLHSQANQTKAKIQKSEGKTQEAIESIKRSIRESYTSEKEAELNDLGGKLDYDDISWNYPGPAETLGFQKFILTIPEYPMDAGLPAAKAKMEWSDFKQNLIAAKNKLEEKIKQLRVKADSMQMKVSMNPVLLRRYNNFIYKTANRKLSLLLERDGERTLALSKKMMTAGDTVETWRNEYNAAVQNDTTCAGRLNAAKTFNIKANTLWNQRNNEWLTFQKEFLDAQARLSLYAFYDRATYELNIATIQAYMLDYLYGLQCESEVGCVESKDEKPYGKELPDFDSVNCTYKDEIFIPPFTKMKFECNKMITEFALELDFNYGAKISPYIKLELEDNLKTGKITKTTIEVGGESGIKEKEIAPIKIEAIVKGGVGIELTENGIESIFVKGGTGVNVVSSPDGAAVTNYTQLSVEAEARMTWESGSEKVGGSSEGGEGHFSTSGEAKLFLGTIHIGGH